MLDQSKSVQALEEFILLGKSAPGAAAAANIQKCISSPNCFVFAELLELPKVQELQSDPEHGKWVEALKLFAYGSYMDYKRNLHHYISKFIVIDIVGSFSPNPLLMYLQ